VAAKSAKSALLINPLRFLAKGTIIVLLAFIVLLGKKASAFKEVTIGTTVGAKNI
jgi:hypothetical protein